MKKSILSILVLIICIFSFASSSSATPIKHEVKSTITDVYYQSESGYYVAHTKKEKDGGFWVLDLVSISASKENKTLTKQLRQMYMGKTVHIVYVYDEKNDEETEIIDTWIE